MAADSDIGVLSVETLAFCRELADGAVSVTPVAEPAWVSHGHRPDALASLQRFLEEHLVSAPARVIARYGLPTGVSLMEVTVAVKRVDLPARLQRELRLSVPCVVVPATRPGMEGRVGEQWIMLPTFDHTFHVRRGEDAQAVIAAEVRRLMAAHELGSREALSLFPAAGHSLEPLLLELLHGGDGLAGRARAVAKARVEEHKRRLARELCELVSVPILEPRTGQRHIGHETELGQLAALLAAREPQSLLVVGEEGVGKTALMQAWRARHGADRLVCATSAAQLCAGMSGFGEWQARVDAVMRAAELTDAVVYFENFAELFGERPERGGLDVAGVVRRYVVDGRVRVVGEISREALDAAARHKPALIAAMTQLSVPALSAAETEEVLSVHARGFFAEDVSLGDDAIPAIVSLTQRYVPYRALPAKAVAFAAELCATAARGDVVGADRAYDAFSARSGIPAFLLHPERALHVGALVKSLSRRLVGQKEAVVRVAEALSVVKARLQPEGRPLATLLFVGPTGVGKTEVARALANLLFGADERMIRFDMSEYADALAAERLIRGSYSADGVLTSKVREQPFSVVLLDEIEKAHPAVFDLLLQVLGEGRLSDARGKTAYFHNAIIIMTSNLGAGDARAPIGLGRGGIDRGERFERAVSESFRPEFIARLDRIVVFEPLTPEQIAEVTGLAIARLGERRGLAEHGIALEVSPAACAALALGGHDPRYGVRALRRLIDQEVVAPVARALAALGTEARGAAVWVGAASDGLCPSQSRKNRMTRIDRAGLAIEVFRRPAASGRRALAEMDAVGDVRRDLDLLLDRDEVRGVLEHLSMLRAQLATARKRGNERVSGEDLELLRREHHRIDAAATRIDGLREDIRVAEQLCMSALFEGEEAGDWVREARALYTSAQVAVFQLLTAQRMARDEVTLALFEPDGHGPLRTWLVPLLDQAEARGWELWFHPRQQGPHGPGWPAVRSWAPPMDAHSARKRLLDGAHKSMLLRASGKGAGLLLALEAGTHRFLGDKGGMRHLVVRLGCMRTALTEKSWYYPPLEKMPTPPGRGVAVERERHAGSDEVRIFKEQLVRVPEEAYWARIEEVLLAHLLFHLERGTADGLFTGVLDTAEVAEGTPE